MRGLVSGYAEAVHGTSGAANSSRSTSLSIPWLGIAFAAVIACGPPTVPSDLGTLPDDQVTLAESPALAHLAAALEGGPEHTVAELVSGELPSFTSAPDPSELFALQRREHDALPTPQDAFGLRVLTYNVGLLSRWYPITKVEVAEVERRRELFTDILLGDKWDVLMLQEVWEPHDVARLEEGAERLGYELYAGTDRYHEYHGLVTLVRSALIDPDAPQQREELLYEQQRGIERFPARASRAAS